MKLLISAGPTREFVDAVRYISNASSGRMGVALSQEGLSRGWLVRCVHGPVEVMFPKGAELVPVTTADEMMAAMLANYEWADIVVMAAAVSDWKPENIYPGKLKKETGAPKLNLVPNPDILKTLGKLKKHQILCGFALESENIIQNANKKLTSKNCDLIIANPDTAIGGESTSAWILAKDGRQLELRPSAKTEIARKILDFARELKK